MIGADATHRNDPLLSLADDVGQDELQPSYLIAAVNGRNLIISLDPEVFMSQVFQTLDGRRRRLQPNPGQLFSKVRKVFKKAQASFQVYS